MDKSEKIKELTLFYETLLIHLEKLTSYASSIEDVNKNIIEIILLNEKHLKTRESAKILLSEDLSNISNNFIFKLIAKDITPTSIKFINLVTFYNESLIQYKESNDNLELEKTIKDLHEFNKMSQKQFKGLKENLLKLS